MYVDFHSHFDFYKDHELDLMINDIDKNNIKVIACSMDLKSYNKNIKISKMSNNIIPIFGIHPWSVKSKLDDLNHYDDLVKETKIIGEIGLDFYWVKEKETYKHQIEVFKYFLKKSKQHNKFLNIHTKGAEELIYNLLKEYDVLDKSIIHWYSGDINILNKFIDAKCYFTVSVDLNYSEKSREILKHIPIDKLLAETDGPTALEWVNGNYGKPSEIIKVYENISKIKKVSKDYIKDIINKNSFNILK